MSNPIARCRELIAAHKSLDAELERAVEARDCLTLEYILSTNGLSRFPMTLRSALGKAIFADDAQTVIFLADAGVGWHHFSVRDQESLLIGTILIRNMRIQEALLRIGFRTSDPVVRRLIFCYRSRESRSFATPEEIHCWHKHGVKFGRAFYSDKELPLHYFFRMIGQEQDYVQFDAAYETARAMIQCGAELSSALPMIQYPAPAQPYTPQLIDLLLKLGADPELLEEILDNGIELLESHLPQKKYIGVPRKLTEALVRVRSSSDHLSRLM